MTFSDVEVSSCFHPVALRKFFKHRVVVRGIIAGYMANLAWYPKINYSPKLNSRTHFVDNFQSITYLVEGLSKASAIVRSVHSCKSKEGTFECPFILCSDLNPMACDRKVTV